MKTVDNLHQRAEEFSTDNTNAPWKALFVRLEIVFRQSRWIALFDHPMTVFRQSRWGVLYQYSIRPKRFLSL
jgi:hypothetical protein